MLGANDEPNIEDGDPGESDWNLRRAEAFARGEPEPQWADAPPLNPSDVPFLREGLIAPPGV